MSVLGIDLNLVAALPSIARIIAILVLTVVLRSLLSRIIRKTMRLRLPVKLREPQQESVNRADTLSGVLVQVVSMVLWIVAGLTILSELDVDIAPVLATVGLGALAVGLAAQNVIRDYLNGFFIIMEDWYRVGEVAEISGTSGLVEQLNLRRTVLRDLNGTQHIFPNGKVDSASNMTRDFSRINLDVSVAYKENLAHIFEVIDEVGQQLKDDDVWGRHLLTAPLAQRVNRLGDSGIDIKILADTKPSQQWALTGELRRRLKDRFDQEGIEIPWPHTKVFLDGNSPRPCA
ncbi:MAG: mechanosensitive ion channel family protein [Dehalococcoidia bacterium]|jgi:small conductance mechanosensitive channel|nr:mechanosensitive ion channel family protein [Dehalococcoidia bacterium]